MSEATKIALGIVGVVLLGIFLVWYHGVFIRECVASGNTPTYCEIKFWSSK